MMSDIAFKALLKYLIGIESNNLRCAGGWCGYKQHVDVLSRFLRN